MMAERRIAEPTMHIPYGEAVETDGTDHVARRAQRA
jgi:hypothetical protein